MQLRRSNYCLRYNAMARFVRQERIVLLTSLVTYDKSASQSSEYQQAVAQQDHNGDQVNHDSKSNDAIHKPVSLPCCFESPAKVEIK